MDTVTVTFTGAEHEALVDYPRGGFNEHRRDCFGPVRYRPDLLHQEDFAAAKMRLEAAGPRPLATR